MTNPNIIYEKDKRRVVDIDSGMAVEFLGYGPHARERDLFFKLFWKNKTITIKGSFDSDDTRIMEENPTLDAGELFLKIHHAAIRNIYVFNCNEISNDRQFLSNDDGNLLVLLVQRVMKEAMPDAKNVNVRFLANPSLSLTGTWSVEG